MKKVIFLIFIVASILLLISSNFKKKQVISYFSFRDLVKLSNNSGISEDLSLKLQKQLTVPFVVNKSTPVQKKSFIKPFLRLAQWNIERGLNINAIKSVFSNYSAYYYVYKNNIQIEKQEKFKKEINNFSASDIISLNEVDVGMPRTKYRNVVSELADSLGYNYAFATEFIELSSLVYKEKVDPKRYLGLHGNAILSKYPIISAMIIRLPQCYNWYESEIARKSPLESGRRIGAKEVFKIQINNEPRRGGRNALIADIQLPNKGIIKVISIHLEDRCYPSGRVKQVKYLLENLKNSKAPIVIAGDFNTSTSDTAPTSVTKEVTKRVKDPHFIARQIALFALPIFPLGFGNIAAGTISKAFHYKDPTFPSIPVLFPNQERELFDVLKDFRFSDGEGFDFRGDSKRSSNGKRGLLANSNERQLKGFESTFRFNKPYLIAYFKLDWFFVKPKQGRFEPFNGQTLKLVNESFPERISDHDPITVDLKL